MIAATVVTVALLLWLAPCAMALVVVCRRPQTRRRDDDDIDSGWGGGGPGGRPGPDGRPGPGGGSLEPEGGPVWWPEFERQFAAYVDRARRVESPVRVANRE